MRDAPGRTGVLVMAHGTPQSAAGIEDFYTSIRGGRRPPADLLAELEARYAAIGGVSPLTEVTRSQVEGLAAELDRREPGRYLLGYGAKHVDPSIERAVTELVRRGADRMVALVLAPHESSLGSGAYLERASAAAALEPATGGRPVELVPVRSWHRAAGLADLLAERTDAALASLPPGAARTTTVLFTAHSLPQRAVGGDDPYPRQVRESAEDVAGRLGLGSPAAPGWAVAWQSAGRTPDPWLGPALVEEIDRFGRAGGRAVVVCPVGFVADHLEVLYDLDVEAAAAAAERGLAFARTASLNDDPRFIGVLADVVQRAAGAGGGPGDPAATGAGHHGHG